MTGEESMWRERGINKFETANKGIDKPILELQDYVNAFTSLMYLIEENFRVRNGIGTREISSYKLNFSLEDLQAARRRKVVPTVEDRYLSPQSNQFYQRGVMRPVINEHPQEVARIDALVRILNACQDVATFKKAYNDIIRILFGKNWRSRRDIFEGEEYDPDKLDVDAVLRTLPN